MGTIKGYEHRKDEAGLTQRDRDVRDLIAAGLQSPAQIGERINVSRQRASVIRQGLVDKGVLEKREGVYVVVEQQSKGGAK